MAKIYTPPEELPPPEFDGEQSWEDYDRAGDEWTEKLRQYCLKHGNGDERGEIISFPVGDGSARYMVFKMNPVALIHMPLGDAWQYCDADLQTASRIRQRIQADKALAKIFKDQGK